MKIQALLPAFLFAGTMAVWAQTTVFSDSFSGGSTINSASPTLPTATATSYEEISAKTWTPNPPTINSSGLTFGVAKTSGGGGEVQALFTTTPVTLASAGDFVRVAVTFTNTVGLLTQDSQLGIGLFNSGQVLPFGGGLNGTDETGDTTPNAVSGGAQNWNGYIACINSAGGSKVSEILTRPPQTTNDNRNQITVVPGDFSSLYGYPSPTGTVIGSSSSAANIDLTNGIYTVVLTLALQSNGAIQIDDSIYTNTAAGALITTLTETTGTNPLTNSFDAFALGFRSAGDLSATTIGVTSVQVTQYIQSQASCITAAFTNASTNVVVGQTNVSMTINIPTNDTSSKAVSVQLVSTNPAAAYPTGSPGGTLTVTFPQGAAYSTTNVPIIVAGAGSTLFYLDNASGGNCISSLSSNVITVIAPNPNAITKTEHFNSAFSAGLDGWMEQDSRCSATGMNYGFSPTQNAGGATVGEGGGVLQRNSASTSYSDIWNSAGYGRLSLDDSLSASGLVAFVGSSASGASFAVGFTDSTRVGQVGDQNELALEFKTEAANGCRADLQIGFADGSTAQFQGLGGLTGTGNSLVPGRSYEFTFQWNPVGGTNGGGLMTGNLYDAESGSNYSGFLDLTPAQRRIGATFDSFGVFNLDYAASTTDITTNYIDDVTYTALPGGPCGIIAGPVSSSIMAPQNNGFFTVTIPGSISTNTAVTADVVSANPAVAYPAGAPGGTLAVTFLAGRSYLTTNVSILAAGSGTTLVYISNATSPACISADVSSSLVNVTFPGNIAPALPTIPSGIFNITNYGAVGDGVTTNTVAVQNTINATLAAGGGTVEVPAGAFLCGPLTLGSSIRFQLDAGATVLLPPYGSYPGGTNPPDFIYVNNAHDIEFCGPGVLNGQGAGWWASGIDISEKPYELHLNNCLRVFIHNWNSTNPPMKHIVFDGVDNEITIQDVTNTAPYPTPNTDCLNLQGSNCLVQNCVFHGGDDNIAMGRDGVGEDILITNITCGTGHGISIGSITSAGISNVTVVNCTFNGTDNGLRLKADNDRGGLVRNITYQNISMTNVDLPIVLYSYYNENGQPDNVTPADAASYAADTVTSSTPIWRNISFSNITATSSDFAGIIWGRTEMWVTNVTLDHVVITAPKAFDIYNAEGIQWVDSQVILSPSGTTYELYNAQVTLSNSVSAASGVSLSGLSGSNSLSLYNATATLSSSNLLDANPVTLSAGILTNSASLTLPPATVLNFDPGSNLTKVAVTGNLTLNGTVNIAAGNGFENGLYTLFTYSGSLTGAASLGTTPPGCICSLNTNTAGKVNLLVSPAPPSFAYGSLSLSNGLFSASGTGGAAKGNYHVLTTTNLLLPLSQWTTLTTNQFDGSGNFSFSAPFSSSNSQQYYLLRVP